MRILHCHSTFSLGGKEARAVRLMNLFGDQAQHVILSAVPDALGARDAINSAIDVSFPGQQAPPLHGKPSLSRYIALARYMQGFDLVLTYNWGSMDVVAARRLFAAGHRLPRLIHHEDGFNASEHRRLKRRRNWFRRLMLPASEALVVPSFRLETIARDVWRQPASRVRRIANGIDLIRYADPPRPDAIPGFVKRPGDIIVGTLAGLRTVKNLPRLVRAVATLPSHVRLVIVGEGPERANILAEASRAGLADRLLMPGFLPDPFRYVGLFDIFALSSDSEQFPISLVEAMAAGCPAVATDVGDIRTMVAAENQTFITPAGDDHAFAEALRQLVDNAPLRQTLGAANQLKAKAEYDEQAMVLAYRSLYRIGGA